MQTIWVICYDYDGGKSTNPNAICLNEMLNEMGDFFDIKIITSTSNENADQISNGHIEVNYLPISKNKKGKIDFKSWGDHVADFLRNIALKDELNDSDHLLAISFPFNVLEIAFKIKKIYPQLNFITYELDPYTYNKVLKFPKILFFYRYFKESRIFKASSKIMLTHELYEQYSKSVFSKYGNKFKDIGIPLLKTFDENLIEKYKKESNLINIAYIGSFYKKIREPNYMIKVMSEISEEIDNLRLNFYGSTSPFIGEETERDFDGKLILHGRVAKEEIKKVINDTHIFINIGNTIDNQLPSKVLEYIGTGKPIIHFYKIDNDTSNKYLFKYPNVFFIKEGTWDTNKKLELIEFLKNAYIVSSKEIQEIFHNDTLEVINQKVSEIFMDKK